MYQYYRQDCVRLTHDAVPGNVASQHIQQHGFCDVICVVARHDAVRLCEDSSPIQSLPNSKNMEPSVDSVSLAVCQHLN